MDQHGNFSRIEEFTEQGTDVGNFVLTRQVAAVLRASIVLGRQNAFSVDTVVGALANAEETAQYVCGFNALRDAKEYVTLLGQYLTMAGYVASGNITEKGLGRATTPLPPPIEEQLRKST